jgi:hypothetical protein
MLTKRTAAVAIFALFLAWAEIGEAAARGARYSNFGPWSNDHTGVLLTRDVHEAPSQRVNGATAQSAPTPGRRNR